MKQNQENQRPSSTEKFAPRFDGLRFIETLVTAHRQAWSPIAPWLYLYCISLLLFKKAINGENSTFLVDMELRKGVKL